MMEKIDLKGYIPCYNVYKGHGGSLDALGYDKVSYKAMQYIAGVTLGRALQHIDEDENIIWCHAQLCDQYAAIDALMARVNAASDITSETVGPHSVHYASAGDALEQSKLDIYDIARMWLRPYMFRGVALV